ncbi:GIY-YIG nuclease family protein [Brevundimonas aurifodinae]|uniref:GIY-YIG nuclease family protein n=2 Tax=Brevundimonas TaxID=41275 RepID=A0ABV1NNN7_9CAUL|nr:MAG: GIY-YIG nuclease [Brevundimonas sp. 12-68-7]OYX34199.1 MAG: GIY-YIG nuclease [Brevundimonas subvibrioides]
MSFFTYIVASGRNGTIYAGSTEDLRVRVHQHKDKAFDGFAARYGLDRLVWYEIHDSRDAAFARERRIKKWLRVWKLELIESVNPAWDDLMDAFRLGDLLDAKDWVPASAGMSGEEGAEGGAKRNEDGDV